MDAPPKLNVKPKSQKLGTLLPEVEAYLHLLLLIHLLDSGNTKEVCLKCTTLIFFFVNLC